MTVLENQNTDDFIDFMRIQNGITLNDTYDYAKAHYDELKSMERIFKFEIEDDISRCMTLTRLLTPELADEIINYSRKSKFNRKIFKFVDEPKINKYSTELISAFIYNPLFLKKSWDWCVLTYHKAMAEQERKIPIPQPEQPGDSKPIYIDRLAATGQGIRPIINEPHIWNGISCLIVGSLIQNGNLVIELHIPAQKEPEKFMNLDLSISLRKGDVFVREQQLKYMEDSSKPGGTIIYSTEEINVIDYDNIIINKISGENDV